MSIFKGRTGEPRQDLVPADDIQFLKEVAHPRLDAPASEDVLKHFAETWWNLCLWEKQRADVLDGKATSLVGLASVASAVVAATGDSLGSSGWITWFKLGATAAFLVTAVLAVLALRVAKYPGFIDDDVFAALVINQAPSVIPPFKETDPVKNYYRELAMQRWVVYRGFKRVSETRADMVAWAQIAAIAAVTLLVLLVGAAVFGH